MSPFGSSSSYQVNSPADPPRGHDLAHAWLKGSYTPLLIQYSITALYISTTNIYIMPQLERGLLALADGDNPLSDTISLFIVQLVFILVVSRVLGYLFRFIKREYFNSAFLLLCARSFYPMHILSPNHTHHLLILTHHHRATSDSRSDHRHHPWAHSDG